MQLSHTPAALSISFDDPTLVTSAGLVRVMRLADTAGLSARAQHRLTAAGDKRANAGVKITSLVTGMVSGADSIDDMDQLRHGGMHMHRLFTRIYAPSTLGSFLRSCTFGHVRQSDAVASRFLTILADQAPAVVPARLSPAGMSLLMSTTPSSKFMATRNKVPASATPASAVSMPYWPRSPRGLPSRWAWRSACVVVPAVPRVVLAD